MLAQVIYSYNVLPLFFRLAFVFFFSQFALCASTLLSFLYFHVVRAKNVLQGPHIIL